MTLLKGWHIPPRRVVLWYGVSALPLALVVALGGYLSYHYHTLSIQSREQVDRAYEVLEDVDALFVAVQDAELAERDVLIGGGADRVASFQAALRSVVARQAPLHTELANSAPQLARLARLELAIAAKTTALGQTVALQQPKAYDAARRQAGPEDRQLMERVRNAATELLVAERRLLIDRQQASRQHERNILLTGVCIAALSVTIRLLVAWLLARLRKKGKAAMDGSAVS